MASRDVLTQFSGQASAAQELQVLIALQQMEDDLRKEYDVAVRDASYIVQTESKIKDFLRVENMNPVRAANRLARYWKERKKLFGDRWLLPLNQTGFGALSAADLEVLRSGYLQISPRPSGGILALVDESKLTRPVGDSKMRLIFYYSSLFLDHSIHGKTIVHIVNSNQRKFSDLQLGPEEWRIRESVMPGSGLVRPRMFVAQAFEEGKQELLDFLSFRTLQVEQFRSQLPVQRLVGNSPGQVLRLLEQEGIERHLLPASLGGGYHMKNFNDWIRTRLTIEGSMSSAPIMLNHLPLLTHQSSVQPSLLPTMQDSVARKRSSEMLLQGDLSSSSLSTQGESKSYQHETPVAQSTARLAHSQSMQEDTIGTHSSPLGHKRQRTYQKYNDSIIDLSRRRDSLRSLNQFMRQQNAQLEIFLADASAFVDRIQSSR